MIISFGVLLFVGFILRLCLIAYGEWQDRTMAVKFTDIDYFVFNDAASYIAQGKSPYLRATYRYTPLLAWMLQPNIWLSPVFGKLVFITLDVLTGYLIYYILCSSKGIKVKSAKLCASFWLFNPLPMAVSSRGNAEPIMTCLVLLCLKLLQGYRVFSAALVFSLAVHFKIYPVTYAIPIYLILGKEYRKKMQHFVVRMTVWDAIKPNRDRSTFVLVAGVTLTLLTAAFYHMYGFEFLYHTYLYHVTRKDIRHNFSVYFYMLYQQSGAEKSIILGLLSFVPQVLLLLIFSFKFYRNPALVFFLNTFAFVTFNKVCTSQYFLWYLCLLPLLLPHLRKISHIKAAILVLLWFTGQALWLLPAYYLEFQGVNTFLYIWLAGLVFFAINCYILCEVINNYSDVPFVKGNSSKLKKESNVPDVNQSNNSDLPFAEDLSEFSSELYKVTDKLSNLSIDTNSDLTQNTRVPEENISRNTRSQTKRRNKIK